MKGKTMVVIGSGNVAEHLGKAWYKAGINIVQIYARNKTAGKKLARSFNCTSTTSRNKLIEDADYYCVAVSDDAIPSIAKELKDITGVIFQTSGAVSIKNWGNQNFGVVWPVASISDKKVIWKNIPFVIEASNDKTLTSLRKLVAVLGAKSVKLSEEERSKAHVAAVFTNNFREHILFLASNFLTNEKISPNILAYLAAQVPPSLKSSDLSIALTGPAKRGDQKVIKKQIGILKDPELKKIYKLMSQSITEKHGKKL